MDTKDSQKTKFHKNRIFCKSFTFFLCIFLLLHLTVGCADRNLSDVNQSENPETSGMGRYVETITDLPDSLSGSINKLFRLADDSLILTDTTAPFLVSEDNGDTWLTDERPWHTQLLNEGAYVIDVAIGPDNTTAVIYQPSAVRTESDPLLPQLMLIESDGTQIPVTVSSPNDAQYLVKVFTTDCGRIFVTLFAQNNCNIYEVLKDGSSRLFLTMDEKSPDQLLLSDHLMIIYGTEYESPLIYDVASETYLEDAVLSDFIIDHTTRTSSATESNGSFYATDWYIFTASDNSIWLAGQGGLYRHTIGGSALEQIIDGNLSVLSDPSYHITGIIPLDDYEFLAVFRNRKLVHFTYDPSIPSKPSKTLKVYSVENNDTIRKAITLYLSDHPDIYIEYDIGMSADDAATREDALKKLNTKIMAGNGPDVIVMDNIPLNTYIKKGVLKDLSPVWNQINETEPLFTNIGNAMKSEDGNIYALPCEIQIPILFGDEVVISQMNDLKSIADMTESLRQENPGQDLFGFYTTEDILRLFTTVSAPSWTTDSDELNIQYLSDFLEQTKRLYIAQNENNMEDQPEIYVVGTQRDSTDARLNLKVIEYVGRYLSSFTCGILHNPNVYAELNSVNEINGFESCGWKTMNGQNDHVFIAQTIVGISSTTHNTDCAEDFLRVCLSTENQLNLRSGLPVNKTALNNTFPLIDDQTSEHLPYDSEYLADSEGNLTRFDIYPPNQEAITVLRVCIEDANTPYIENKLLEDAVCKQGIAYLQGDISLEEALDSIKKQLTIYMTE